MTGSQNTRGYERYFAIDTHREYHLVGGQNEDREWVVPPRRVSFVRKDVARRLAPKDEVLERMKELGLTL